MQDKNLYIIAGCNGAGRITASFTILPEALYCREFVNADEIARGLSPFQPEKVALEAGRIMLSRISDLRTRGEPPPSKPRWQPASTSRKSRPRSRKATPSRCCIFG